MIQYGIRNKATGKDAARSESEARELARTHADRYELIQREVSEWRTPPPIIVTLAGGHAPYQVMEAGHDKDGREHVTLRAMTVDEAYEAGWSPGA
ncbi:hypothetical protein BH760_gp32 [Gordonia phage Splinter]|uniref:Uncharacterized protein n=2 Tax=Vendettavirus vendetta TaxID=2049886 RepID=A0A160DD02_9CAUD|nr:hypothetical protein BH795_gp32 [Gordonia phage Vendetta]YP_009275433.1 hypothetical protein BH760_gp32 [Gordonia phage Splinter]ANA85626.1 hypothetical protein PBI_VENDETTA_79 [Gordonia phage Vendetta]ANA85705.1 hypothetical protein PBI_SPLINTER_79 [Gordonia phage Splinter]